MLGTVERRTGHATAHKQEVNDEANSFNFLPQLPLQAPRPPGPVSLSTASYSESQHPQSQEIMSHFNILLRCFSVITFVMSLDRRCNGHLRTADRTSINTHTHTIQEVCVCWSFKMVC